MKKRFTVLLSVAICASAIPFAKSDEANLGAENLESDVVIIDRGPSRIEEYKAGNRVYMIRVVPSKGIPYYLVDSDGNGSFETRRNELSPSMLIPSWVIFSW